MLLYSKFKIIIDSPLNYLIWIQSVIISFKFKCCHEVLHIALLLINKQYNQWLLTEHLLGNQSLDLDSTTKIWLSLSSWATQWCLIHKSFPTPPQLVWHIRVIMEVIIQDMGVVQIKLSKLLSYSCNITEMVKDLSLNKESLSYWVLHITDLLRDLHLILKMLKNFLQFMIRMETRELLYKI